MHCSLSSAIALLLAMFIGCHGSSSSGSSSLDANRFSFILKTETRPKSGRATAAAAAAAEAGSEWSPTVQQRRRTLVVVVVALMASASGS